MTVTVLNYTGRHNLDRRALALIDQANQGTDDRLLTTPEVAVWLGVTEAWLEIGRSSGRDGGAYGPPFIRLSPRRVRYRRGDVKAWLLERSHRHTSEYLDTRFGRAPGSKVVDGRVVMPEPDDAA